MLLFKASLEHLLKHFNLTYCATEQKTELGKSRKRAQGRLKRFKWI